MKTYEDNVEVINQLWQSFTPTHELRQLFRERLHRLDQDILYEAIKQAKVENDGPWPSIKWFTSAFSDIQKKQLQSAPYKPSRYVRNVIPDVDAESEKVLIAEFCAAIEGCTDEGFYEMEKLILDKYDASLLSSLSAFRLLRQLLIHLGYGVGSGLSRVGKHGETSPLEMNMAF